MKATIHLQFSLIRAALSTQGAQKVNPCSVRFLRITHVLYAVTGLLVFSSAALAQVEPALPGSVEYGLTTNNYTWVLSSDPISVGGYVEDLMSDYRAGQPVGRGEIGMVTATGWDADYNEMAATVDFGRDYSVGIVFPELSAVEIVPIPEPSTLLVLLFGVLLARTSLCRRTKPAS